MQGIVVKSTGSWYKVRTDDGQIYDCRIVGKLRLDGIKSTNPVSVGDKVDFELEPQKDTAVIKKIHNRKNYLIRKSVNLSKQTHIIAANIDLAFILITVKNPKTYPAFIDRFLATAEAYRIPVVLLFNKIDNYDEYETAEKKDLMEIYQEIGYTCVDISAEKGININQVKELMKDKVSLFVGHSGVGKTTLINKIESNLKILAELNEKAKENAEEQKNKILEEIESLNQNLSSFEENLIERQQELEFLSNQFKEQNTQLTKVNYFSNTIKNPMYYVKSSKNEYQHLFNNSDKTLLAKRY